MCEPHRKLFAKFASHVHLAVMKQSSRNLGKRWVAVAAAVLIAAAVAATLLFNFAVAGWNGDADKWLYIKAGTPSDSITALLRKEFGVTGKRAAVIWALAGGNAAKAHGAYRISPGISAMLLYRTLCSGTQTPVKLTFNNLRTVNQLAGKAGDRLEFDSIAFMKACDSILKPAGFTQATYPAAFLPDTYEFYWTASPEKVVETLLGYRNRFWDDSRRTKAAALGLTPVETATIASIAEEETNDRAERAIVARLYLNRLNKGMKLQADPTVKFAAGDFTLRRIKGKHLSSPSPYNTYLHAGLPPGPIRIADPRTIDALLDSKPHNFLYMCAKEDFSGRHNFAVTYDEHQRNAARYHRALNSRNIK